MIENPELKENTVLIDKFFPLNVFHNTNYNHRELRSVLHTHWHDNIEIIYFISGEAMIDIGNRSYAVQPGDILFVNSKQLHSGYSVNNTYVDYYAIVFNKSILASQVPDPRHAQYIAPFIDGQRLFPERVEKSDSYYPLIKQHIEQIIEEFERKLPAYELNIKSHLQFILTGISRHFIPLNPAKRSVNLDYERNTEQFKKLISYVEHHFSDKITVEQAAQIVSLSPHHFCKTFKKLTGKTFVDYLNLYRINEAEKLLRTTELPITHISEQVGFNSINYFSKIFKQYKRYSPSQSRK